MSKLEPVDRERCQADKPGNGPFVMGGEIGDPKNGYRIRCKNKPTYIATEKQPGKDGKIGAMSLCGLCSLSRWDQTWLILSPSTSKANEYSNTNIHV
jgi:hypothetical protein